MFEPISCVVTSLSVIYLKFMAHLTSHHSTLNRPSQHSEVIRHPIWFALSGTIICFSTGQWPNTPPGCVRAIWPRKRVMECCIRWPGLHNHPTSTQLRWFEMSWSEGKAANKCSAYVGSPSRLLEKHSRGSWVRECQECKAVIKAKGGYFEESQI